ncbi:hypothetical protein QOT17_014623 [Balamuthia mandrillaris]
MKSSPNLQLQNKSSTLQSNITKKWIMLSSKQSKETHNTSSNGLTASSNKLPTSSTLKKMLMSSLMIQIPACIMHIMEALAALNTLHEQLHKAQQEYLHMF